MGGSTTALIRTEYLLFTFIAARSTVRPHPRVEAHLLGPPAQCVATVAAVRSYRLVDLALAESNLAIHRL